MFKNFLKSAAVIFLLVVLIKPAIALENKVPLYFFWANGCPHCVKEKIFLKSLADKYPQLLVKDYEVTANKENIELLEKVGKELSVDVSGVPFTVIGKQHISGYLNEETTGQEIESAVQCAINNGCEDLVLNLEKDTQNIDKKDAKKAIETLNLPLFGEIKVKNLSLPVLTFFIALLDGFNPCAMWTLLFLISLLIGMKDRKRMWILGIAFIMSSALVYFLFLSAWLNFFLFLGFVFWVRVVIGLVALGSGSYYLKDYFVNKNGSCNVTGNEKRQKIFEKLKIITQKKQFIIALGGIILLAFAVNLVELVCSAGLPAIYTQILSLANLPRWHYYLYLIFYIFIFMLDDLIVFAIAMLTLQITGVQSKYSRLSHLIGGILMLIIGILLLFKPEILMFG